MSLSPKKRFTRPSTVGWGAGILVFLGTMYWYAWSATPLTSSEIDTYLQTIAAQDQVPGREHDLVLLRDFLEADEGKPFYTVNLYRFYDQANYAPEALLGGTGREAFDRFSSVMVGLLAARASHPIFGSDWVFAHGNGWDRIVIVRYRSRRDIVDIFASPEFEAAAVHKWAGLEENGRMLVQGLHVPAALLPAILFALLVAVFTTAISTRIAARS